MRRDALPGVTPRYTWRWQRVSVSGFTGAGRGTDLLSRGLAQAWGSNECGVLLFMMEGS